MQRDRGQCFIQVEAAVVDRMRAMRRPGESYSEVILRLVELETSDQK
jgi:predicted CopG family antitoxin